MPVPNCPVEDEASPVPVYWNLLEDRRGARQWSTWSERWAAAAEMLPDEAATLCSLLLSPQTLGTLPATEIVGRQSQDYWSPVGHSVCCLKPSRGCPVSLEQSPHSSVGPSVPSAAAPK